MDEEKKSADRRTAANLRMKKSISKILVFAFLAFVLAVSSARAYNEKISACLNDICTVITDDLPDRATGIDPSQKVNLGLEVFNNGTKAAPACEGNRKLFHVVRHFKDQVLYKDMSKNNYEYLNQGEGNVFTYEFNSGQYGQRNRYQGVFYCWTESRGTDRGVLDLLIGNLGTQNQTWSTLLFDQTTQVAQKLPVEGTNQPEVKNSNKSISLDFPNPLAAQDLAELLQIIQTWLTYLAIPIAVMVIVISGIWMMASGGDPGKFGQARKMLVWAVIGLAVILIGEGFLKLIESIINLKNR